MKLIYNPNSFKNRFLNSVKRTVSIREWRFARQARKTIMEGMRGVGQEIEETKTMAKLFFRLLEHKLDMQNRSEAPTKNEVKEAIEQLKDLGRLSIFASVSILPGGGFSLIGLELLARKFGITSFTLVPSTFRKREKSYDKFDVEKAIAELKAIETAGEKTG